jgi:glucose-6-phosphate isomerase
VDAGSLGQLVMLFQVATVYAGALYGIDPLDQPGVELGKILTYGLMGRDGYEAPTLEEGDERWVV